MLVAGVVYSDSCLLEHNQRLCETELWEAEEDSSQCGNRLVAVADLHVGLGSDWAPLLGQSSEELAGRTEGLY